MKPIKVMILDDDPLILSLMVNIFHRRGYDIVTYSNPTACPLYAIDSYPCNIDELCPSIIISDYNMPFVNGVEFIEALRRKGCRCPNIALVSGSFPDREVMERVAKLKIKFFPKPLHRDQINDWLNQIEPTLLSKEADQKRTR